MFGGVNAITIDAIVFYKVNQPFDDVEIRSPWITGSFEKLVEFFHFLLISAFTLPFFYQGRGQAHFCG